MKKTIITAALTGAFTKKSQNPNIPTTPKEIAHDIFECWSAGAAIAHLHMRDEEENGTMSCDKFEETVNILRSEHPECDIVLNFTTSGDLNATDETRQIHLEKLRPEMCSYDAGTMNWMNKTLFVNHPKFLEELGANAIKWGVKPEIEAFDPGMIGNAAYYHKNGFLEGPLYFQFVMGAAGGIEATTKNLVFMKETMDRLCPGSNWSCFGIGKGSLEMMYAGLALGGNIRVGMEDNIRYSKHEFVKSNRQFVERAVRVVKEYGNQPATPDEAREILGLRGHNK